MDEPPDRFWRGIGLSIAVHLGLIMAGFLIGCFVGGQAGSSDTGHHPDNWAAVLFPFYFAAVAELVAAIGLIVAGLVSRRRDPESGLGKGLIVGGSVGLVLIMFAAILLGVPL